MAIVMAGARIANRVADSGDKAHLARTCHRASSALFHAPSLTEEIGCEGTQMPFVIQLPCFEGVHGR